MVRLTAPSSPTKVRRKVGSVLHLYCPLGWTAHDLHMAATDAVRVPSGNRDQIALGGWPLADSP
jgi:hypothetical protein